MDAENISQATQFVATGSAPADITALLLALAPDVARSGWHLALPALQRWRCMTTWRARARGRFFGVLGVCMNLASGASPSCVASYLFNSNTSPA